MRNIKNFNNIQFVDDTLIFCKAGVGSLVKLILSMFAGASGMRINYNKTSMIYKGKKEGLGTFLSTIFGCK